MTTALLVLAVATTAVVHGTDVFAAVVLRPAAARARSASIADLLGHVHHFGDRRLPVPGALAVLATAAALVVGGSPGTAVALAALLAWLAAYLTVSAPVNRRLRAAADAGDAPPDTRALQQRWDSVIRLRAALQAAALGGLLVALTAR